jgi:hypothetical protein
MGTVTLDSRGVMLSSEGHICTRAAHEIEGEALQVLDAADLHKLLRHQTFRPGAVCRFMME